MLEACFLLQKCNVLPKANTFSRNNEKKIRLRRPYANQPEWLVRSKRKTSNSSLYTKSKNYMPRILIDSRPEDIIHAVNYMRQPPVRHISNLSYLHKKTTFVNGK